MLYRDVNGGHLLVSQPAHAWVSGQLAAAWGNSRFGALQPRAELCLAAEQHDIGWLEWEARPTLNPKTGLPRTFMELPTKEHLSVWAPAGPRALVYGPYVALLVSMHGTGLYQRRNFSRDTPDEAQAARRFLTEGEAFEADLLAQMTTDERYAEFIDPTLVARNRRLVAVWDAMSLALCRGIASSWDIADIPSAGEPLAITFTRQEAQTEQFVVDPWPFTGDRVVLTCAARWLEGTFSDESLMRNAVRAAPWRRLEYELVRNS